MKSPVSILLVCLTACGSVSGNSSPSTLEAESPQAGQVSDQSSSGSGESGGCGHSHDLPGILWGVQVQVLNELKARHKTQQVRASDEEFWVQPVVSDGGERQLHVRWRYLTPGLMAPLNEKIHDGEWICKLEQGTGKVGSCDSMRPSG